MITLPTIKSSLLHLFYPHVCAGCGADYLNIGEEVCAGCMTQLPKTNYEKHEGNPVEKMFYGRLPIQQATAQFYFTKESLMQRLLHQFKYNGNQQLGKQLGKLMAHQLLHSNRFQNVEALIALPLFADKEKKRGFNQSVVLCDAISEVLSIPVVKNVVHRPIATETQTKKGRVARWKNMEGKFELLNTTSLIGKHVLLIDDVITTGATLEACGNILLQIEGLRLSMATLCIASH